MPEQLTLSPTEISVRSIDVNEGYKIAVHQHELAKTALDSLPRTEDGDEENVGEEDDTFENLRSAQRNQAAALQEAEDLYQEHAEAIQAEAIEEAEQRS